MNDKNTVLATFLVQGTIENLAQSEFKNEDTGELVATKTIQFRTRLKNGKMDYIDVKVPLEIDFNQFKEGQTWAIPILISSYQGKLFYRANPLMHPQMLE